MVRAIKPWSSKLFNKASDFYSSRSWKYSIQRGLCKQLDKLQVKLIKNPSFAEAAGFVFIPTAFITLSLAAITSLTPVIEASCDWNYKRNLRQKQTTEATALEAIVESEKVQPWNKASHDFLNLSPEERHRRLIESSWVNSLNIPTGRLAEQGRIDPREWKMPYLSTEEDLQTFLEEIKSPLATYKDPFTKSKEYPEGELASKIISGIWQTEGFPIPMQLMKLQTEGSLVQQKGSDYENKMVYALNFAICLPLSYQPKGLKAQLRSTARHFNESMAYWQDPSSIEILAPQPPENFPTALDFALRRFSPIEDNPGANLSEFNVYYRLKGLYLENSPVIQVALK